jgi:hypothetical protein
MARQKKSNKNELDTILEQLKRSYGDESSESLEDELLKSSQSEEDAELNDILNKIFSSDTENAVSEQNIQEDENPLDLDDEVDVEPESPADEINYTTEEEITDAPAEEIHDTPAEEISDAEIEVDNILNIMFSSGAESKSDNSTSEVAAPVENVPVSERSDSIDEDITIYQSNDNIIEDELEDDSSENDQEKIIEDLIPDASEMLSDDDATLTENADAEETPLFSNNEADTLPQPPENVSAEISTERIYISANKDEPAPIRLESDSAEKSEGLATGDPNDNSAETEAVKAHIVIDQSDYTFDPLQEELPQFARSKDNTGMHSAIYESISDSEQSGAESSKAFDSNDISLLLKLGYDDEVISAVGKEKTQEILLEKDHVFMPEAHKKPFGFCDKEFCDRTQIDSIKNRYRSNTRNTIIRLSLVAAISLMIFALNVFFEFFSNRVTSFPTVIILELMFVGVLCLVIYPKLISGAIGILKFETDLYSLLTFLILTYILYDLFAIIAYFVNESIVTSSDLMLFGGPIAVYSLLILISDLANCTREAKTFGIISSFDSFYVAEKQNSAQLAKFGENTDGATGEGTYRIRKTSLVSGYFKKMSHSRINSVNLIYILGIVPTVSVIIGCCCLLLGDNFLRCASSIFLSIMLCIPFSYIFIPSLTEFIISSKLNKEKIAFIGTESVSEYASTKNLIFKDIDSVEITSCTEIQPSKRTIIQSDVEIAHKVFRALSGPLSTVKGTAAAETSYDRSTVIINDIQDNGIEIYFESSMNILIGDKPYMQAHNIKVKTDTNLNAATKGVDRSVIYVAYDGIPKLGFIVNSKIKNDFSSIADLMEENDIHIFVETYEPQINDVYFEQNKTASLANVNVIKPNTFENDGENQSGNGGLISAKSSMDLAKTICACKKLTEYRKHNRFLNIFLSGIGGIFACLFMVLTSTLNYLPFFDFLRLHTSLIFNVVMLAAMTPGIVRLIRLNKNDSIIK